MSRGNRRQKIFLDDVDRQARACGIKTLAEACQKTGWPRKLSGLAGAGLLPDARPLSPGR
jgi:hypothetical protein